jgi:uncharacterized protein
MPRNSSFRPINFLMVYDLFPGDEQARAEAQKIFGELIENEFAAERQQTREKLEKARRFAHAFRFICPSYYIPGKQEGAPF